MQDCAQLMCQALKEALACNRDIDAVYVVCHRPKSMGSPSKRWDKTSHQSAYETFLIEANLVLGMPEEDVAGGTGCDARVPQYPSFQQHAHLGNRGAAPQSGTALQSGPPASQDAVNPGRSVG